MYKQIEMKFNFWKLKINSTFLLAKFQNLIITYESSHLYIVTDVFELSQIFNICYCLKYYQC